MVLGGLHHVTCVCSDAQATTDFYRDELGFQLVKKTVNFDDPHSYHLYFGDETASPGSLLTFFEWPRAERGRLGRGTLESIGLETPAVSEEREVEDPDGLALRLYAGDTPAIHDVVAIGNPDLYPALLDENAPITFAAPAEETALVGAGVTHHIAWRTPDDAAQAAWSERLGELGLRPTPQQERKYFRSIYFRMPDGILHEIATDGPGFMVDEAPTRLGQLFS
jgi:glyoxalase family protein